MPASNVQHYQNLLMSKRTELLTELETFKNGENSSTIKDATGDNSSYTFHMADQGTDNAEREKAYYFATREGRLLYHIEQALERIEDGSYGLCHECSQPITAARLEAVPHARLCINCKMKEENGVTQY